MGGRAGACARHRVWPSACPWCVRVWRIALPNLFCYAESPPLSAPLSYPNLTLLDLAARHCPLPPASRRHRRHRRGRSVTTGRRTSAPALIPETPGLRSTLNKSLGMDPAMLSQNIDLLRSQSQPIKSEADAEGDDTREAGAPSNSSTSRDIVTATCTHGARDYNKYIHDGLASHIASLQLETNGN